MSDRRRTRRRAELMSSVPAEEKPAIDIAKIEAARELKGSFNKDENVFKVSKPRTDVAIRVDRWQMPPFTGLTSWAAFTPARSGTPADFNDVDSQASNKVGAFRLIDPLLPARCGGFSSLPFSQTQSSRSIHSERSTKCPPRPGKSWDPKRVLL